MPSNVVELRLTSGTRGDGAPAADAAEGAARLLDGRRQGQGGQSMSLHVSKLRGISNEVRNKLKRNGVTYTHQLIEAAGRLESRRALAERSGIEEAMLLRLTCRADLARIKGIGAAERFARRAPTQDEVTDWVAQARALPHIVGPDS